MAASDCAHQPMTPERRQVFLDTLAETGSPVEAARQATPWGTGKQAGYSVFSRLRRTDPKFAEQWDDALSRAQAMIEREIVNRAMHPPRKPVYENGEIVAWVEDRNSSDRMLLRVAQRLDPSWAERRQHEVQGQIHHEHTARAFPLGPQDIELLDEEDQLLLTSLLGKIDERRNRNAQAALPAPADP